MKTNPFDSTQRFFFIFSALVSLMAGIVALAENECKSGSCEDDPGSSSCTPNTQQPGEGAVGSWEWKQNPQTGTWSYVFVPTPTGQNGGTDGGCATCPGGGSGTGPGSAPPELATDYSQWLNANYPPIIVNGQWQQTIPPDAFTEWQSHVESQTQFLGGEPPTGDMTFSVSLGSTSAGQPLGGLAVDLSEALTSSGVVSIERFASMEVYNQAETFTGDRHIFYPYPHSGYSHSVPCTAIVSPDVTLRYYKNGNITRLEVLENVPASDLPPTEDNQNLFSADYPVGTWYEVREGTTPDGSPACFVTGSRLGQDYEAA